MGQSLTHRYTLELTEEADGRYSAWVPEQPEAISQGDTLPDAIENIAEALSMVVDCTSGNDGRNGLRTNRNHLRFTAIIHEGENGTCWAEVPALPGCFTAAEDPIDIGSHLQEAIQLWLESRAILDAREAEATEGARVLELAI